MRSLLLLLVVLCVKASTIYANGNWSCQKQITSDEKLIKLRQHYNKKYFPIFVPNEESNDIEKFMQLIDYDARSVRPLEKTNHGETQGDDRISDSFGKTMLTNGSVSEDNLRLLANLWDSLDVAASFVCTDDNLSAIANYAKCFRPEKRAMWPSVASIVWTSNERLAEIHKLLGQYVSLCIDETFRQYGARARDTPNEQMYRKLMSTMQIRSYGMVMGSSLEDHIGKSMITRVRMNNLINNDLLSVYSSKQRSQVVSSLKKLIRNPQVKTKSAQVDVFLPCEPISSQDVQVIHSNMPFSVKLNLRHQLLLLVHLTQKSSLFASLSTSLIQKLSTSPRNRELYYMSFVCTILSHATLTSDARLLLPQNYASRFGAVWPTNF